MVRPLSTGDFVIVSLGDTSQKYQIKDITSGGIYIFLLEDPERISKIVYDSDKDKWIIVGTGQNYNLTFMSSYSPGLDELPPETITQIAIGLPLPDITHLCLTNIKLNDILCNNENFWKEKYKKDYPTQYSQLQFNSSWADRYRKKYLDGIFISKEVKDNISNWSEIYKTSFKDIASEGIDGNIYLKIPPKNVFESAFDNFEEDTWTVEIMINETSDALERDLTMIVKDLNIDFEYVEDYYLLFVPISKYENFYNAYQRNILGSNSILVDELKLLDKDDSEESGFYLLYYKLMKANEAQIEFNEENKVIVSTILEQINLLEESRV